MRRFNIVLLLLGILASQASFATDTNLVRMATTTSTKSSGLLDILVPGFEKASGYKYKMNKE